ncbi:histidine kinase [Streptomyces sp. x-19]|uniref:histidine kinase n=1 Tax=Streptomyces sp. x-19 TaxID=2789280 RepID=UPI003980BF66
MAVGCALTRLARQRVPELAPVASYLATGDTASLIFSTWAVARHGRRFSTALLTAIALGYCLTRRVIGETWQLGSNHLGVYVVLVAAVVRVLCRQHLNEFFCPHERMLGAVNQAARYAVLEERSRLAFDIHDGIGQQVAVVSLQAAAVGTDAQSPARRW